MRDILEMAREAWAKSGEGWVDQNWYLDREKAFKELVELVRADERAEHEADKTIIEYHEATIERLTDLLNKAQPDYAWPTIEDYEKEVGFEVNIAFRSAWAMARTTNDLFKQMGEHP
jgi:hypothetical protein